MGKKKLLTKQRKNHDETDFYKRIRFLDNVRKKLLFVKTKELLKNI